MLTSAILGASGYSGAELMRILLRSADVQVTAALAGKSAGERVDTLYPDLAGRIDLVFEPLELERIPRVDLAFLALPSGEAMSIIPHVRARAARIIDLSGDFRLPDAALYQRYYKHAHAAPSLLGKAVYGLPELNREQIAQSDFVANPGCYPTGAILALLPALKQGIVDPQGIVVNSLSGVSGAGRSSSVELSFTEVNENIRAYKVGNHQHIPEMEYVLGTATGSDVTLTFIPHLVPINRGIYTTISARLQHAITQEEILDLYRTAYRDAPFVRIKPGTPEIRSVLRTNYCDIGMAVEHRTGRLTVMSVIDNMVKGAAGQAVQNMNIMFGFPEVRSLL
jgi:N-acetyl-gamma-glutamyl-phosphate reductase